MVQFSWSLNPNPNANGSSPMFNWRIVSLSILLWIVLMPVFSVIHEYGHAFICAKNDMPYTMSIGLLGGASVSCTGSFVDPTPFRLAGGFLASGVGLLGAVLARKLTRTAKNSFVYIPLFTIGIVQFGQMIMEGFFNTFYLTSNIATLIPTMIAFISLLALTSLKSKQLEEEKMYKTIRKNNPDFDKNEVETSFD